MLCKIACVVAVKYCRSANKTSHFCKKNKKINLRLVADWSHGRTRLVADWSHGRTRLVADWSQTCWSLVSYE